MFKKMMLLALSVAALVAFAAPVAQGAVTDSLGNEAETLTALSENTVTKSTGGELVCATVTLNLERTAATTYSGSGSASGHVGEEKPHKKTSCTLSPVGYIVTIESVTISDVKINGGGTGTASYAFTFTIHTPNGPLMCNNEGTANLTYTPTGNTLGLSGTMKGTQNVAFGCPKESTIAGTFAVTDVFGLPVEIH